MEVQKMKKRILAAALAASMLFGSASVLPQGAVEQWLSLGAHAQTVVKSGTCGENVTWTLDDQGTVTISGSGEIIDFVDFGPDESLSPFRGKESIKKVIIEDGITHIGRVCFEDCKTAESILLSNDGKVIHSNFDKKRNEYFMGCLKKIYSAITTFRSLDSLETA